MAALRRGTGRVSLSACRRRGAHVAAPDGNPGGILCGTPRRGGAMTITATRDRSGQDAARRRDPQSSRHRRRAARGRRRGYRTDAARPLRRRARRPARRSRWSGTRTASRSRSRTSRSRSSATTRDERSGTYRLRASLALGGALTDAQREELRNVAAKCPVHKLMTQAHRGRDRARFVARHADRADSRATREGPGRRLPRSPPVARISAPRPWARSCSSTTSAP